MSDRPTLTGTQIRQQFLDYFAERGHAAVRSASLLPNDPTLMFTNAGMVQFKDVFTGADKRDYDRAVTAQKCLRVSGKHNDLEEVGHTPRHHTLFEMLGNFSFGDYFKEQAIAYAWELVVDQWGLDPERIWPTVHHSDDEAFELWTRKIGLPEARVQRLGDKDNFWSMGDVGPCGPCSELHYDLGPAMGDDSRGPLGGGDRYVEFWNLVFMQYDRHADGSRDALPRPSVDTGMGLERVTAIIQGKLNNYDTDLFTELMADATAIIGQSTGSRDEQLAALRVLADHSRACAFLVADGVIPSNEGRGYVLRRIARRAIRYGVKLGVTEPVFFHRLTDSVVRRFGEAYPELSERQVMIDRVIRAEEERFAETRDRGLKLLDGALDKADGRLDGAVAFELWDTFGFPPDLTDLIAGERGISVDHARFDVLMQEQRERARAGAKAFGGGADVSLYRGIAQDGVGSVFEGYSGKAASSSVLALVREGERVERIGVGDKAELIVGRTPFYPEGGGQVGDRGHIVSDGFSFRVSDTQKPIDGLIVHRGEVVEGTVGVGETVELRIDVSRRDAARRNHTATHLLHAALRQVLGEHVAQKGSLVGPNRLRFDFSHFEPVTPEQLRELEDRVTDRVLANRAVQDAVMSMDEARDEGALAFFGEKYGERVRVIRVDDYSVELCGGTHVSRTGDIGLFRILSETGIAAGVRRIEALTGTGALQAVRAVSDTVDQVTQKLRTSPAKLPAAVQKLLDDNAALRKVIEDAKREAALSSADDLLDGVRDVAGVKVLAARVTTDPGAMRDQADQLRDKLGSGVVVLGTEDGGKAKLLVAVTSDLAGKKLHAGKLVKELAGLIGGRGGGRPDFAQAGGDRPEDLGGALEAVYGQIETALG